MSVQALGYIGLRAKELGDWAKFGSDFLGMQRIDKTRQTMAFRMDDRKQRVIIDADGGQGIALLRLGGCGCGRHGGARGETRSRRRQRGAGLARARGRAAREGPDRVSGPGRHAHRGVSRAGGRRDGIRSRPQHLGLPHRPARHGARRAALRGHRGDDGLLRRPARLSAQRLFPAALSGAFLSLQSAPPLARAHRDGQERAASHHDGAFLARRCRAGLRHRARQRGTGRGDARPPLGRLHDVVLFVEPVRLHDRIRLGRAGGRRRDVEAVRAAVRSEHLGPRSRMAHGREAHRGARDAHEGRARTVCASPCR